MNNKEPEWFISSLRWSFSAIALILLFLGVYSFIYYSTISLDSKISSFFSFISTFGIAATIGVYFWQKNDNKKTEKEKIKNTAESYYEILRRHFDDLKNSTNGLIKIHELSSKIDVISIDCISLHNMSSFDIKFKNDNDNTTIRADRIDITPLSIMYANSTAVGSEVAKAYWFIYNISSITNITIDSLISNINNGCTINEVNQCLGGIRIRESLSKITECMEEYRTYCMSI